MIDELENGPRREFIKNKSFDEIFPKKWVKKVINTEIDCDSIGWRGFMISNGLIWFDRMESGKWTIKSINGVNQEDFDKWCDDTNHKFKEIEWCHYGGLPSPLAYE